MVEVDIEILQRTHGCETERKKQIPPSHQLVAGGGTLLSLTPIPDTLPDCVRLSCGLDHGLEPAYQKKVRKVPIWGKIGFPLTSEGYGVLIGKGRECHPVSSSELCL